MIVITADQMRLVDELAVNKYSILLEEMMELALPKEGLLKENAKSHIGSLYLADIGIPGALYKELGLDIENIFQHGSIIKLLSG